MTPPPWKDRPRPLADDVDQAPQGPTAPSSGRVVYAARCSWWDTIDKVGTTSSGLPVCPSCGSPLFEQESEAVWWEGVDEHERTTEPGYRAFVEWLRGKCYPSVDAARDIYSATTT